MLLIFCQSLQSLFLDLPVRLFLFPRPLDVGDQGSEVLLSVYPHYPGDLILVMDENSDGDANESPTSNYSPDLQPKRIRLPIQTLHLDSPQTFGSSISKKELLTAPDLL